MRLFGWFKKTTQPKAPVYADAAHWAACHFPDAQRDVGRRVAEILVEQVGVELDGLAATSRFVEDLRMTDLEPVEVVMAVEHEFGFTIPRADCEPLSTVGDLVRYLYERVQTNAA